MLLGRQATPASASPQGTGIITPAFPAVRGSALPLVPHQNSSRDIGHLPCRAQWKRLLCYSHELRSWELGLDDGGYQSFWLPLAVASEEETKGKTVPARIDEKERYYSTAWWTSSTVSYATEVTAFAEKGKLKKITGVKTKELMLWLSVVEVYVPDASRLAPCSVLSHGCLCFCSTGSKDQLTCSDWRTLVLPLEDIQEFGYNRSTGFMWLMQGKKKVEHTFKKISRGDGVHREGKAGEDRCMRQL
ncbi:hypothetical protein PR202_ga28620 [Eleusine coracana subsp. coracana]|uniref:Uncharacterized protein n=1 Tax=Eleusine coracana subsp. coracana TaxID=191504 RepID=A0AAV5DK31_ELECO|nr:hypothetical protein PR202_ga28620 [Eleusine coracana subsp. coracana]